MDDWHDFLAAVAKALRYEKENGGDVEGIRRVWEYTASLVDGKCEACTVKADDKA